MQTFGSQVDMTSLLGMTVIGNGENGCIVGLDKAATRACDAVLRGVADARLIRETDEGLYRRLEEHGFFAEPKGPRRLAAAYLHVTQRCNLECTGCYSRDAGRNTLPDPSLQQLEHAVRDLSEAGVSLLIVSGGEPFLREDLSGLIRYAKEGCGVEQVCVLTNGMLVEKADLASLAPFVDHVAVSFDGCSDDGPAYVRGEQRFGQLVSAVRALQRVDVKVQILPTIHARNLGDIPRYAKLAQDMGVDLSFSLFSRSACNGDVTDLCFGEEDMEPLAEAICAAPHAAPRDAPLGAGLVARNSCGAGSSLVSVAADGSVFPCHMLHDERFLMGNVFRQPLSETLQGKVARLFASLDARSYEGCSACNTRLFCGGGCRARAVAGGEGVCGRDTYCEMIRRVYDRRMKDIASRLN
ncbi:radical SAM/SPASM domain-containing protein [Adlercreutzia sp. ZJ473]|uniref:radical SAM/SPASM domain-containing protein n=1 Tax=Adlercreutzia sp. ZJ473 TaxID=2722822 RepID=UPI0015553DB6|nr:radical SAM protein [Adlercreutzia sp. ZJ473]